MAVLWMPERISATTRRQRFEWSYGGSGPAQLSLALLADALGDAELAQDHYQTFKRTVVAIFEEPGFIITQAEIRCWIAAAFQRSEGPSDEASAG